MTAASLLGIAAVVLLVVFLSHVSKMIQVSHVTAAIAEDTLGRIDSLLPDRFDASVDEDADGLLADWRTETPATVLPLQPGYVQRLGVQDLMRGLPASVERVAVLVCPGDFVSTDMPIAELWPATAVEECVSAVLDAVSVTSERDLIQDVDFGVRQLADTALKAISPSINDPATAVTCINYLRSILVPLTERAPEARVHSHPDRELVVVVRRREFHEYFDPVLQISRYAGPDAWVIETMLQALGACVSAAIRHGADSRLRAIRDVLTTVHEQAHAELANQRDRRHIDAVVARIDSEAARRPAADAAQSAVKASHHSAGD